MRIDVTNLSKIIRGSVILDNISIHFESGHIYGIIGKNGSGKTMFEKNTHLSRLLNV